MSTRDLIRAEIDRVGEEHLDELYRLVQGFTRSKAPRREPGLLRQLKQIQIDAPEDFSEQVDRLIHGMDCGQ